jgi:hypothetical protein
MQMTRKPKRYLTKEQALVAVRESAEFVSPDLRQTIFELIEWGMVRVGVLADGRLIFFHNENN